MHNLLSDSPCASATFVASLILSRYFGALFSRNGASQANDSFLDEQLLAAFLASHSALSPMEDVRPSGIVVSLVSIAGFVSALLTSTGFPVLRGDNEEKEEEDGDAGAVPLFGIVIASKFKSSVREYLLSWLEQRPESMLVNSCLLLSLLMERRLSELA